MKIVPDTSILIDGILSQELEKEEEDVTIIIPELVVDELENQANRGKETGNQGIKEIERLTHKAREGNLKVKFVGRRPTEEEIKMAENGRIDALIRDIAEEHDAKLYTADRVQYQVAKAKGIEAKFFEHKHEINFDLEDYFDEKTMSIHLKQGSKPRAKRGVPGEFKLETIGEKPLEKEEIEKLIEQTIEMAETSEEGLIEMQKRGATVVQLGKYRIAITRPPFSEKAEITAVRPVAKVGLEDYDLSDELMKRLNTEAEGILIAGAPGHGKSTFAQALAEHYQKQNQVIKTMEKPRDLDLSDEITQYTGLEDSMENTGDFLLLVRPDYTVFDEIRKTDDFEVYSDMRMAGVGMIGIVHANEAVDAVQRLIGRVELGMIPQICDTVVFIQNAQVARVYNVQMSVKVPEGMTEEDLARPVIEITNFETGQVEYEIYTYGEETVVIPVKEKQESQSRAQQIAKEQLKHSLSQYAENPEIEFISDNHIRLLVDEDEIPHIIGRQGQRIDSLEDELGLDITVEPKKKTFKDSADFELEERGNSIIIDVGDQFSGEEVDVYDEDDFLFTATVGKNGEISITKQSDLAGRILGSEKSNDLEIRI